MSPLSPHGVCIDQCEGGGVETPFKKLKTPSSSLENLCEITAITTFKIS